MMKQKQNTTRKQDSLLRAQLAFYDLVDDLSKREQSINLASPSADKEIAKFDQDWQRKISDFFLWMVANRMYLHSLPDWQAAMLVEALKNQVCDEFAAEDELELICPMGN